MYKKFLVSVLSVVLLGASLPGKATSLAYYGRPAPYSQIFVAGELGERVTKNFNRLEESKYQPDNVFLTEAQSGGWPGDTEGRTILGLALDAQAQSPRRSPLYLDEIIRRIPSHLNEKGYMGPIYADKANEQQLSGNGWMLRGLCEYYLWTHNESVLAIIRSISEQLFLGVADKYASYPINPTEREQNVGAESGNIVGTKGQWMLSSDIGCVFIGMDGLIQAYGILKDAKLKAPIQTLINKFLQIDLTGIKAQTHATLTACRGLIRYAEITGENKYVNEAAQRFRLYVDNGMTENYENYNWFDRFDTWTEPCAIVDSYLLAVQLWQHTGDSSYLEYAERIYYNALCHTQRWNGGFGCDNCPGLAIGSQSLGVHGDEAHWCCTMRGGEGMSCAVAYSCMTRKNEVLLPFFHEASFALKLRGTKDFSFEEQTDYPFSSQVKLVVKNNSAGQVLLKLAAPSWLQELSLTVNGQPVDAVATQGFVSVRRKFKQGDVVEYRFKQRLGFESVLNKSNAKPSWHRAFYGPLLLGAPKGGSATMNAQSRLINNGNGTFSVQGSDLILSPIYHRMDKSVWSSTGYQREILF